MGWDLNAGLEAKGVVVTGAAGGIGQEVVRAFAAAGARVCAIDLEEAAVRATVDTTADPVLHLPIAVDVTRYEDHESVLRRVQKTFGSLDVLVHLAAVIIRRTNIEEITETDWDRQNDVNLKATFFLNRAAGRIMREQGPGGRIINFTSQAWWTGGLAGSLVYAVTKGGIVSLTRGLAREYARDGITVNVIAPGGVDTSMARSQSQESLDSFISQTPMGRLAEPAEIASATVFLASDHARYITGATLNITGGQLMY